MRSLVFGFSGFVLLSVITAFPTLHQSFNDDDLLDLFSSSPQANSDTIGFDPLNILNDSSENLFSDTAYVNTNDDPLSSSDSIAAKWDGLSSYDGPEPESQPNLFDENSGLIAFNSPSSDSSLLSHFPVNQDISYDLSSSSSLIDGGTLVSPVVGAIAQAPAGPPSCSSLKSRKNIVFQSLCCESPCIDIQSWRSNCRSCM